MASLEDEKFQHDLKELHDKFIAKIDTIEHCRNVAEEICKSSLKAYNIDHTPVVCRTKKWESAKGSILRRNEERKLRQQLKNEVLSRHQRWDIYTHEHHIDPCEDEERPFESADEMLGALHDFAGIRISLYFPGDKDYVTKILRSKFDRVKIALKGQSSKGNVSRLQDKLNDIRSRLNAPGNGYPFPQGPESDRPLKRRRYDSSIIQLQDEANYRRDFPSPYENQHTITPEYPGFAPTFPGYKATHLIVHLKERNIPQDRLSLWRDVPIEIQIGTVAMHLWSEIEHDMIYKPIESQLTFISDDEKRVLDLINGIVLTGEAALGQLEASSRARSLQRQEDGNAFATSHHELAVWFDKYCRSKGYEMHDEWEDLPQLFAVLKAIGKHRQSSVKDILEVQFRRGTFKSSPLNCLPTIILGELCNKTIFSWWDTLMDVTEGGFFKQTALRARLWATRLAHSLNLATYFGVGAELLNIPHLSYRPSLTAFLDLLHPQKPKYSDIQVLSAITECCLAVVGPHRQTNSVLVRAAINLPEIHMITAKAVPGVARIKSDAITVPGIIARLFPFEAEANQSFASGDASLSNHSDNYNAFFMISLIGLCMHISGINRDARQLTWYPDHERPIESEEQKIDHERCFLSLDDESSRDKPLQWDLLDHNVKLEISQFTALSMREEPKQKLPSDAEGLPDNAQGFVCRLHPKKQWNTVKMACDFVIKLRKASRHRNPPRPGSIQSTSVEDDEDID